MAREVEEFRNLLDAPAVVARADELITHLEAVAGCGKDLWRSRQDATVASGAPEGSPLHGAGSQEALAQCERWATEAEGVILGGLADAARLLHPPGGAHEGGAPGRGEIKMAPDGRKTK